MYSELDRAIINSTNPLLIDGDNILRRMHAVSDNCIKTLFYSLKRDIEKIQPDIVVLVWDGGHCPIRTEAYPEYKVKRKERDPEEARDYGEKKLATLEIFKYLPVWTVQARTEADDVIGYLIARCSEVPQAWILSTDKDFAQLIGRTFCDVNLLRKSQIINLKNIKRELGYDNGIEFLQMRLLAGDSSDNLKGVVGIGEKKANQIIEDYQIRGGDSFPKRVGNHSDIPDTWGHRKREFIKAMELSSLLMDLFDIDIRMYTRKQLESGEITGPNYNKGKVIELLKKNDLYEFTSDYLNFIQPYLKLGGDDGNSYQSD